MYLKVDKPLRGKRGGKEKRKVRRKEDEVFRTGEKGYSRGCGRENRFTLEKIHVSSCVVSTELEVCVCKPPPNNP